MNKRQDFKYPDIAVIAYLAKEGHKAKFISEKNNISLR